MTEATTTKEVKDTPVEVIKLFKSRISSCMFLRADGKPIHFVSGRYATKDPKDIEELTAEVNNGHPYIYIDSSETEVAADTIDPVQALRAKLEKEIRAEYEAALNKGDMGSTKEPEKAEGNVGTVTSARLAELAGKSQSTSK